jgi:hypothetical protein
MNWLRRGRLRVTAVLFSAEQSREGEIELGIQELRAPASSGLRHPSPFGQKLSQLLGRLWCWCGESAPTFR